MNRQKLVRSKGQFLALTAVICILILFAACLSVLIGAVKINPNDSVKIIANKICGREIFVKNWEDNAETIIWNLRLPRVLMAFIAGAGLSVCGVLMQALTKNSLADSYVLGISSGASAGAVCAIVTGCFYFAKGYSTILGAILGAGLSIVLSLRIASLNGKITSTQLVLAGIATSSLFSAFTNLVIYGYHTGSDKAKTAQFWMAGSFSGADWNNTKYVLTVFGIAVFVVMLFVHELDILLLGDDAAESLGVHTGRIKIVIILTSAILTGVVVSVSGVIGFVGLVIPHIARSLAGSKHIRLLPLSVLTGGLFMMLADMMSRVITAPEELPVGIISSFTGAPFFLYLIRKSKTG